MDPKASSKDQRDELELASLKTQMWRAVLRDEAQTLLSLAASRPELARAPILLKIAAREGKPEATRALLSLGAPMDADAEGWTPLAYAIANGHEECFGILDGAFDQAALGILADGSTMLTMAVKADQPAMVESLWARVDPAAKDSHGRDALDWARLSQNDASLALLALNERARIESATAAAPSAGKRRGL